MQELGRDESNHEIYNYICVTNEHQRTSAGRLGLTAYVLWSNQNFLLLLDLLHLESLDCFGIRTNKALEEFSGIQGSSGGVWYLQTADCRLHEAARLLIEWNQKYRNKGGVIINITLFRKVRPRSEVYIFHANYTDLIPKGAVGRSFRIELEQNNVCRCHKLAHESIATV